MTSCRSRRRCARSGRRSRHARGARDRARGLDAGAEASLVDRARIIAARTCAWFEPDTHGESTPMVSNADIDLFFRMCQCKLTHIADNLADEVTRFDADFDGAISIDELKAHAAQNKERYLSHAPRLLSRHALASVTAASSRTAAAHAASSN